MIKYFGTLRTPLFALAVTALGVLMSVAWFDNSRGLLLFAVIPLAFGVSASMVADKILLPNRPIAAVRALQAWILAPVTLAVVAAAFVVIFAVTLTVPSSASTVTMKTIGALSTGVTTFLTTGFIAWTGDSAKSPLADYVKGVFQRHFRRGTHGTQTPGVHYFAAGTLGELLIQSDAGPGVDGWGWPDRLKRAQGIAHELETGDSDPKPPGPAVAA